MGKKCQTGKTKDLCHCLLKNCSWNICQINGIQPTYNSWKTFVIVSFKTHISEHRAKMTKIMLLFCYLLSSNNKYPNYLDGNIPVKRALIWFHLVCHVHDHDWWPLLECRALWAKNGRDKKDFLFKRIMIHTFSYSVHSLSLKLLTQ